MPSNSRKGLRKFTLFGANDDGTTHHPNCSAITDAELAYTIDGVWPSTNGRAKINYVFSLPAFYWLFSPNSTTFHLRNLPWETTAIFQNTVRLVLSKFVELNNGILSFNEVPSSFKTNYSPFFRGIYYAQVATEAQFANDGEGAFTVLRFDNNGYIKQGLIYLPTDLSIYADIPAWNPIDWINQTISHETSHSLGGQHLQNYPDILTKLENIPDGVFCSVMDYPNLISTNISACMQNCTPDFAIYPGPLDIRSMQLAYLQGEYDHGYDKTFYYALNACELLILFAGITFIYTSLDNFFSALEYKKNHRLIPNKLMQNILNLALLILFIEMDAPDIIPILFAISASIKLIPEFILNRSACYRDNLWLKYLLNCRFPLDILAITTVFAEGLIPAAFFLTAAFTGTGVIGGRVFGMVPQYLLVPSINTQLQKLIAYYFPPPPHEEGIELARIEVRSPRIVEIEEKKIEEVLEVKNPHRFFNGNPPSPTQVGLTPAEIELATFDWALVP